MLGHAPVAGGRKGVGADERRCKLHQRWLGLPIAGRFPSNHTCVILDA
jgi:hypothetical protein